MDNKKVWNGISIVCIIVGFCVGYLTLRPLINLLKPNPDYSFITYSPSQGFGVIFNFSILSGLLLGFIPFSVKHLNGPIVKTKLSCILLALAGLSGSLLSFFYLKLKYVRAESFTKDIGLESSMQIPPMFLIPLSGIVLMLLSFLALKLILKNKNPVNPV